MPGARKLAVPDAIVTSPNTQKRKDLISGSTITDHRKNNKRGAKAKTCSARLIIPPYIALSFYWSPEVYLQYYANMSTTANKEQSGAKGIQTREFGTPLEPNPSDVSIGDFVTSLDYSAASHLPFAYPTENVLYDDFETFDIPNWNDDARADQTALLSPEFNHANVPSWNYNSTGDTATAFLDPFMNFQNYMPFEENTASIDYRYFQGLCDGIDMGINFHGQEMNSFASAPNITTEQDFIFGEVDTNIAFIGQQATPPAPLTGSFANHVAPAPRFACNSIGCGKTFGRQSDCNRHMKKHEAPEYSCPEPGCGREFYRRDKVMDHARRIHHLEL
ncbi:hypothetical protein BGAL_0078g00100 [Botrytis galanthina]|uniref:C2H2-type domain-containing protein n=1 Tax=Botrytis galanthina TaxID=278940 RepID=A0A4S8R5S6_9HELO|nr:hypothetical protein BGAL_0078g00100 [Botrytis galanthina]